MLEMPQARCAIVGRLRQALGRVLPDGLEKAIAPAAGLDHHERLVDQVGEQRQHVRRGDIAARAHRLHRLERRAAGEHGEPPKQDPLLVGEEVVTPVDRARAASAGAEARSGPRRSAG